MASECTCVVEACPVHVRTDVDWEALRAAPDIQYPAVATMTPWPQTEAFAELLRQIAAGDIEIGEGLRLAYQAGLAERAAA